MDVHNDLLSQRLPTTSVTMENVPDPSSSANGFKFTILESSKWSQSTHQMAFGEDAGRAVRKADRADRQRRKAWKQSNNLSLL